MLKKVPVQYGHVTVDWKNGGESWEVVSSQEAGDSQVEVCGERTEATWKLEETSSTHMSVCSVSICPNSKGSSQNKSVFDELQDTQSHPSGAG